MKATTERLEGCQVALTIEIEPEEMEDALKGAYKRMVNQLEIPGFRKGKAPRALLERHVGKESMDAEALDRLLPALYDRAVAEQEIEAIAQPEMEMTQTDPPIFKATIPVRPVVELGDYRSIRITAETNEITSENIDEGLDNLLKMHSTLEPVERDAQMGDMVTIDVRGTVDEEDVMDTSGSQYRIAEDNVSPVPGFCEQLIGMKAEDEKEFTLSFPEDHESEELAGKDCLFKVAMSDIKEEHLPELDDEFAKSLGQEIETIEQLRDKLETSMRAAAEKRTREKLESDVLDAIVAQSKIEFPAILVEHEVDRLVNDQLMRLGGMQLEDYLRYRGVTEEEFKNDLRPMAEKHIAGSLIINKVHETEKTEVTESEVNAKIDVIVEEAGEQSEAIREMFNSSRARESIEERLLSEKTMDLLINIATGNEADSAEETPEETPDEAAEPETLQESEEEDK